MARMRPTLGALLISLALAAPAAAHDGVVAAAPGTPVKLRDCFLTAAFVPRPASALRSVFDAPLDLSMTFYGPDPLVGVWGMSCDRARVGGRRAGSLVLSLVGVPVGLTSPEALPLANNFAHRLFRMDTNSARLAAAARRVGLPVSLSRSARYTHSPSARIPSTGRLVVPRRYSARVNAADPDPTNPHDHANVFEHRATGVRRSALTMSIDDAFDRFCVLPSEDCAAVVKAARRSPVARLLGGPTAQARAGFDHDELARVDLVLTAGPARLPPAPR